MYTHMYNIYICIHICITEIETERDRKRMHIVAQTDAQIVVCVCLSSHVFH